MTDPRPVPAALAKRGLVSMTDNIPPGGSLRIDAAAFVRLFRAELEARGVVVSPPAVAPRGRGAE